MFPLGHYQEQHSRQMADKWMLGLVTNYWSWPMACGNTTMESCMQWMNKAFPKSNQQS
jgi:hypothetical protein